MKHSVYSKIAVLLTAALLFTGCVEHEEISFEGVVVGTRACTDIIMDSHPGFIVQLFSPDSIGGSMTDTSTGETMEHLIVLYEPPRLLYIHDTLHGTFYLDDKYSRANCGLIWRDMDLPEGVFLKVVVD